MTNLVKYSIERVEKRVTKAEQTPSDRQCFCKKVVLVLNTLEENDVSITVPA